MIGLVLIVAASDSFAAASWRVSPIRLDFDQKTRSGVVTITNDGDASVSLQIKAFLWTQDEQGKDRYEESNDLVFFPRIMTLRAGDSRVLRAGIQVPATSQEKSYRLFVEEIPEPRSDSGAVVAIAIRFGIPVFVTPIKVQVVNEFSQIGYRGGELHFALKNAGNVHYRIQGIKVTGADAQGAELWNASSEGWYLLAGNQRSHAVKVAVEDCSRSAAMTLFIHTDKGDFSEQIKIDPTQCTP